VDSAPNAGKLQIMQKVRPVRLAV